MLQRVESNPHTYYCKAPRAEGVNPASAFKTELEALSDKAIAEHNSVLNQRMMEQQEAMGKMLRYIKLL